MIKFGVAGNSNSFYSEGNKSTIQAGAWCKNRGIDVFEYSFGKGINIKDETAHLIGEEFAKNGVELTVHAPYYINFANPDEEKINNSINYVMNSIKKLYFFKGDRVVVHPATQGKATREVAVDTTLNNLLKLKEAIEINNLTNFKICLETMGKLGQIGTLEEIVKFCNLADFYYPCVDFGHLNARTQGQFNSPSAFEDAIKYMLDNLPFEKVNFTHIHFSKIMFSAKGEVKHLTFADEIYGPNFEDFSGILHKYALNPVIICESDGTQAEDTIFMKNHYFRSI